MTPSSSPSRSDSQPQVTVIHPERSGPTPRVKLGIERNLATTPELHPHRAVAVTRSWQETEGLPLHIRRAKMLERVLAEEPVRIQDGELIVGMKCLTPRGSPVFPEVNCAWVERDLDRLATRSNTPFFVSEETKSILCQEVFPYWRGKQIVDRIMEAVPARIWRADDRGVIYNYWRSRTIGHITVGYAKVLQMGMTGIKDQVNRSLGRLRHDQPGYLEKKQFLESVAQSCEAAVMFAGRYAAEARRLAARESDPIRKAELLHAAGICDRVPAQPARTFQEALQSFWFTQLVLNLETDGHAIGPGRFDQYLYPYYSYSLETGELTQDQAQELLDLMWVKLDEITLAKDSGESQTSSSYPDFQNLNIGGLTRDGRDATNELSFMTLTALEHVRAPQPGLSAQVHSKTSPKFLVRCCELIKQGMGMPAMFNSDNMVLSMVNRGKSLEDARAGSVNGCVACNCDGLDRMASTGYMNLAKCLELALNDGLDRMTGERLGPSTGDPRQFNSFDQVVEAYRQQVRYFVEMKVHYDNLVREIYAVHCPVPFTSAVIDDCVDRAIDWHAGGARYNIATMSGVGIGTVADSLAGIKKHVFDGKKMTMAQLIQTLDDNWADKETWRQIFLNKTPHYGNDEDYADDLALLGQKVFCEEVEKHRDCQGAAYCVDLLPTTSHIALGEVTGATPDGRRAGVWLSEGVSPVQGHDKKGPTAVARSVGKLDHARTNGTLLNVKISPQCLKTSHDLHKLADLIRAYFDQGGHHMQINVVDVKVLEAAMAHPEDYRNLLIRVAGYSDYFVLLSPDIQREIISRTEHAL